MDMFLPSGEMGERAPNRSHFVIRTNLKHIQVLKLRDNIPGTEQIWPSVGSYRRKKPDKVILLP
jgi:hypothetical protein